MNTMELLESQVKKLKANRDKIPEEELKTKYLSAYEKLQNSIMEISKEAFRSRINEVLSLFSFNNKDIKGNEEINNIITGISQTVAQLRHKVEEKSRRILLENMDVDQYNSMLELAKKQLYDYVMEILCNSHGLLFVHVVA